MRLKNLLYLVILFIFHVFAFSQSNKKPKSIKYDDSGQAIAGINNAPLPNTIIYYNGSNFYRNSVKEMGNMVNGLREGEWISFHQTGINDDNIDMKERGNYVNGKKEGIWYTYYDLYTTSNRTNAVKEKVNYIHDKIVGEYINYTDRGETRQRGNYNSEGQADGDWLIYSDQGGDHKLIEKRKYSNGKLIYKAKFVNDEFIEVSPTE